MPEFLGTVTAPNIPILQDIYGTEIIQQSRLEEGGLKGD